MKIFSNHRRKLEPYRRFGGREFKDKLTAAKNHKRLLNPESNGFFSAFFTRTGLSKAAVGLVLLITAVIFYFLVVSPYFVITEVSVEGNKQVPAEEIRSAIDKAGSSRFMLVRKNNFFVLNSSSVNKLLVSTDPLIKETKSSRIWPDKLKIEVTERNPVLVINASGKYYLVDDLGFVLSGVSSADNYLAVTDQINEDIQIGSTIDGKLIPFIISVKQAWPTKLSQTIASVKIPGKGASEVEFLSSEGWSVFFSTDRPVASQLNNLVVLLNKQIGKDRGKLAYIDLRISKWAYYCFKSSPCQQTDQSSLTAQQLESQTANNPTSAQTSGANTLKP